MNNTIPNIVLPVEEGINNEPRCPVVILIDRSSSMSGAKIQELNEGLQVFASELKMDPLASLRVEPLIIAFNDVVDSDRTWVSALDFTPASYQAAGGTSLATALIAGLDAVEERKITLRQASLTVYRPWVFIITDGEPTDQQVLPEAIRRAREAEDMKKASIFAVGVQGADMTVLRQLSPSRAPLQLQGTKFRDLFQWLSASLSIGGTTPMGQQATLPPVLGWATVTP